MNFRQLIHEAMSAQRRGHSVEFTTTQIAPRCASVEQAHWISRAAEVYRRILDRERRRGRVVEWV